MTNWKFDILGTLLYIQPYQFLIYLYSVQLYWHVSTVLNSFNMWKFHFLQTKCKKKHTKSISLLNKIIYKNMFFGYIFFKVWGLLIRVLCFQILCLKIMSNAQQLLCAYFLLCFFPYFQHQNFCINLKVFKTS